MAVLYLSRDVMSQPRCRRIAISLAQCWGRLEAVGVVGVRRVEAGWGYVVTEPITGSSLFHHLRNESCSGDEMAVALARGIIPAMASAASVRIYHLCLTPRSIFLQPEGRASLVNFGFGHLRSELPELWDAYHERYRAPEQASGEGVGAFTDVYSMGIILEDVLGVPGYRGGSCGEGEPGRCARGVREPWARVIRRATAPDPPDRYGSLSEMGGDLGIDIGLEETRRTEGESAGGSAKVYASPGVSTKRDSDDETRLEGTPAFWAAVLVASLILAIVAWLLLTV